VKMGGGGGGGHLISKISHVHIQIFASSSTSYNNNQTSDETTWFCENEETLFMCLN